MKRKKLYIQIDFRRKSLKISIYFCLSNRLIAVVTVDSERVGNIDKASVIKNNIILYFVNSILQICWLVNSRPEHKNCSKKKEHKQDNIRFIKINRHTWTEIFRKRERDWERERKIECEKERERKNVRGREQGTDFTNMFTWSFYVPKAQKDSQVISVFLRFWDLRALKLLVKRWWNQFPVFVVTKSN